MNDSKKHQAFEKRQDREAASTNIILKSTLELLDVDEEGIYHIPSPIRIYTTLCGWAEADFKEHSANTSDTKVNCPECIKAWQFCRQLIVP